MWQTIKKYQVKTGVTYRIYQQGAEKKVVKHGAQDAVKLTPRNAIN
jgi:hypothetical protein